MSIEVADAGHAHHDRHPAHESHGPASPHGYAADQSALHVAGSPLWWSATQRLACAGVLAAVLWLVIAWALV